MTCKTFIFLKGLWSQSVITVANPSPPSQPPIRVPISQPIEVFKVCEQCPNVKYERERYFVTVDIEKGMQDGQKFLLHDSHFLIQSWKHPKSTIVVGGYQEGTRGHNCLARISSHPVLKSIIEALDLVQVRLGYIGFMPTSLAKL
ncbi:hypothetical protein RHMOL_Rhmol01G0343700 [Rhododendron molle]|uniref:Uncharacterized protein n=1 Tax=Rhododendron molle TaxID=49168 RepID=A0ACC0QC45_RHOML|nr:hypothetical protein RHMOL_Rhmol01G0343700 [Rhododendron molle]